MILKKEVVLLGDSAGGKKSLIKRFVLDAFEDSYVATVGSKVTRGISQSHARTRPRTSR